MQRYSAEPFGRSDAVLLRDQAVSVLSRLLSERSMVEQDLLERGRIDPIKAVTGRSALDNAILSTRRVIDSIDRFLETAEVATCPAAVLRFSSGGAGSLAIPAAAR